MSNSKKEPTPGPWKAKQYRTTTTDCLWWGIVYEEGGHDIADHIEHEADARLIAAAPELLSALRVLLESMPDNLPCANSVCPIKPCRAIRAGRAAIKKAEGGEA